MGGSQSDKNVQLCADRFKKRRSWRMTPLPPRRPILEETVREDANRLIWNCANNRSFIRVLSPPSLHSHTKWPRYLCHLALQSSSSTTFKGDGARGGRLTRGATWTRESFGEDNYITINRMKPVGMCLCDFLLCRLLLSPFPPQPHTSLNRPEIGMDVSTLFTCTHSYASPPPSIFNSTGCEHSIIISEPS